MNLENRPVYPRLQFLDLVPRLENPTTSEGFGAVHEVNFKVRATEHNSDGTTAYSVVVEWHG